MQQLPNCKIANLDCNSGPYSIVMGKDGNLWVTETKANRIARLTQQFDLKEYDLPSHNCGAMLMAATDDGVYYTEYHAERLGFISYEGKISEHQLTGKCSPFGIATDDEGAVWFVCMASNQIGRFYRGEITYFDIPTPASFPSFIVFGADGALWFTENQGNKIGRITKQGNITEFELPSAGSAPVGLCAGKNALWFAEIMGERIGSMDYSGNLVEYEVPTTAAKPHGVAISQDGIVAFTEWGANKIGIIERGGELKEYSIPIDNAEPHGLIFDDQGYLWFALEVGAIGRALL